MRLAAAGTFVLATVLIFALWLVMICVNNERRIDAWYEYRARVIANTPATAPRFVRYLDPITRYYGYEDRVTGEPLTPAKFLNCADEFSEGLAWFSLPDGGRGFVNEAGDVEFMLPKWTWPSNFYDGVAKVSNYPELGTEQPEYYIDRDGDRVHPGASFYMASEYRDGYALVRGFNAFGKRCERFSYSISIRITPCFGRRAKIIDQAGNEVPASRLINAP